MQYTISKSESTFLKGIGIILIVLHNFFHSIPPVFGENQFEFSFDTVLLFWDTLSAHPAGIGSTLLAFFGHYGVQLFIFLSGYGLMRMYGDRDFSYRGFITRRLIKLYPVFTIALILLLFYQFILLGVPFAVKTLGLFAIRYTLLANIIPGKAFTLCGPHWFYSMIVQLYLLFPLLLKAHRRHKHALKFIMGTTLLLLIFTNDFASSNRLSLYYNFPGNLPVFLFGMIVATTSGISSPRWLWMSMAVVLFVVGQFSAVLWYFTPLAFVVMVVPVAVGIWRMSEGGFGRSFLLRTGEFSMYLFAVHGFMRSPWTTRYAQSTPLYSILPLLLFVLSIIIAALLTRTVEGAVMPSINKFFNVSNRTE